MKGLKIILGVIAVMLVLLVLQHEREHRAAVTAYSDDANQRFVQMYGNKTWEQVQRERAQEDAKDAAADRALNGIFK